MTDRRSAGSARAAAAALRAVLLVAVCAARLACGAPPVRLELAVSLDPARGALRGTGVITAPGEAAELVLGRAFAVESLQVDGRAAPVPPVSRGDLRVWALPASGHGRRIEIAWRGTVPPADPSQSHRDTLGLARAASGLDGSFLPASSAWYPSIAGAHASYELSLDLPAAQKGLVPGRLVAEHQRDGRYRARFEFPEPAEGIDLMTGPYEVTEQRMQSARGVPIRLRTYFHPRVAELAPGYLESAQRYIALYEQWIGPYPFSEFSIVSSPTPTGFGMPTLTYLGVDVLRLPFIRDTSLGHEVLHNWWGNGVYPDYARGNWSEGLTTFMADYAYQERAGEAAATAARLEWLRDFAAIPPGQDRPLDAFTARTHGTSQIVGYDKSAMLFFMLRDLIGAAAFDRGIRAFWSAQRFRTASWDDLRGAFEKAAGRDLARFFSQWVGRSGAPSLVLEGLRASRSAGASRLDLTLVQRARAYALRVPLRVRTDAGVETHEVEADGLRTRVSVPTKGRPQSVAIDPGFRLFRRLAAGEAPPILRQVMVDPATVTVVLPSERDALEAARDVAARLQDQAPRPRRADAPLGITPILVVGLHDEIDRWLAAHDLPARPPALGNRGTAQVWTQSRRGGAPLVVVSARDSDALAALIRPLPHYGRQSYLAFDGARAIEQGVWPGEPPEWPVP